MHPEHNLAELICCDLVPVFHRNYYGRFTITALMATDHVNNAAYSIKVKLSSSISGEIATIKIIPKSLIPLHKTCIGISLSPERLINRYTFRVERFHPRQNSLVLFIVILWSKLGK